MAPHLLRRTKDQVMTDLPPIMFNDVVVEPAPLDQYKLELYFTTYLSYLPEKRWEKMREVLAGEQQVVHSIVDHVGFSAEGVSALAALQSKVSTMRRYVGLQKVPAILDLVKSELDAGAYQKIVIFAVHQAVLEELREGFRDYGCALVYGGTPDAKRNALVDWFQTDTLGYATKARRPKKCRVFLGNIEAAGVGINLTAAHQVMFAEADWVPAKNQQAAMRCHRVGQTKPVTVRFVGCAGSIDEKIQQVLKQKTRTLTALFDAEGAPQKKINIFE